MTVTNDGTNYFSGTFTAGVSISAMNTDIDSMLTTLGVPFDRPAAQAENNIAWRPNGAGEFLAGVITNQSSNLRTTDTLFGGEADCRFKHMTKGNAASGTAVPYIFNTRSTVGAPITGIAPDFGTNLLDTAYTGASCWAVATTKSLATFIFLDTDNYLFVTTGVYDNLLGVSFPETCFGYAIGHTPGIDRYVRTSQLSADQTNNNTTMYEFGALVGDVPPNYDHVPTSGSTGDAWELYLRRTDNDFATGIVPNCIQVDQSVGGAIAVGTVKNFDNITQGNDNIMGSTQDYFIKVGEYGVGASTGAGGDSIFMRVSSL